MIKINSKIFIKFCVPLLVIIILSGCTKSNTEANLKPTDMNVAVPVLVSDVVKKELPVQVRVIGNVEAYSQVSIKTLVKGEVLDVHFKEGQEVNKNDLLFTIDKKPFEAALKQAQANLAKSKAQKKQVEVNLIRDQVRLRNSEREVSRYAELVKKKIVPQDQYDQLVTDLDVLKATIEADVAAIESSKEVIKSDEATIENAKIQLDYCSIYSPIHGCTGTLLVHKGNVVKDNDTILITINQISPIYVSFFVQESLLPEIKKRMAMSKLDVEVFTPENEDHSVKGTLCFMENTVDRQTGTIRLKGYFDNEDKYLWPGQFVNVVLTLFTQPDAIVIPSHALQTGQQGQFVFIVKQNLTVESRSVVIDRELGVETVIKSGLTPGEKVVTDGQTRLVPGRKVEIKSGL